MIKEFKDLGIKVY